MVRLARPGAGARRVAHCFGLSKTDGMRVWNLAILGIIYQ
jgi:hypothetical protein